MYPGLQAQMAVVSVHPGPVLPGSLHWQSSIQASQVLGQGSGTMKSYQDKLQMNHSDLQYIDCNPILRSQCYKYIDHWVNK